MWSYLRENTLKGDMNAGCNHNCWQGRKDKTALVHGKLVVAAVERKVECDCPVSQWLGMKDVPALLACSMKCHPEET